ncbi:MAG: hypothetical protein Q7S18_02640 [bacterium]|nr:hypothetical protein [bacterium]
MDEDKEKQAKTEETYEVKKIDFRFELVLFLILGFLLGVVIKTEAVKRITFGYNDREVISLKQGYDFQKIKEDIISKSAPADQSGSPQAAPSN